MRNSKLLMAIVTLGALAAFTVGVRAQVKTPDKAEIALRAAMEKESVAGDLKAAIAEYRKVATTYAKSNRAIAARALLRMGQCHEKLGNDEARKTYQQVISLYGDLKESTETAKLRLAALSVPGGGAVVARRVMDSAPVCASVSADGRYCPHAGGSGFGLFVRNLTTGEDRRISSVPDSERVFPAAVISPDGKWIVYLGQPNAREGFQLRLAGMEGTAPRTLFAGEIGMGPLLPTGWTPDAKEVLVLVQPRVDADAGRRHVAMISVATGQLRILREFPFGSDVWPSISPDGKWVAYNVQNTPDKIECDIHVIRADGTGERKLVEHPARDIDPVWTPDGRGLVFRSNRRGAMDMWFLRVKDGQADGEPILIMKDAQEALLGVTRNGTLYYRSNTGWSDINLASLDPSTGKLLGAVEKLPLAYTGGVGSLAMSPDGSRLAYTRSSLRTPGVNNVVVRSMRTGEESEHDPGMRFLWDIQWYPDGQHLVLSGRDTKGSFTVFKMDARTGNATALYTFFSMNGLLNMDWPVPSVALDGRTFYPALGNPTGSDLPIIALDSVTKEFREVFRQKGMRVGQVSVSPDGQYLGATFTAAGEPSRSGLLAVDAKTGAMRELCTIPPAASPQVAGWTPDGRRIILAFKGEIWLVPLDGGDPQKSAVAGITANARSAANRIVWKTGTWKTEMWALDNAIPAK